MKTEDFLRSAYSDAVDFVELQSKTRILNGKGPLSDVEKRTMLIDLLIAINDMVLGEYVPFDPRTYIDDEIRNEGENDEDI